MITQQDNVMIGPEQETLRFFYEPQPNNFQSERQNRPIFDTVLFVEVITPGSSESSPVIEIERIFHESVGIEDPVRTETFKRYAAQVAAFKAQEDAPEMRGTPITAWTGLTASRAAELKHSGVHTVEALSALPDSRLLALGPDALNLRDRAKAFLSAAGDGAAVAALDQENRALRGEVERLAGELLAMNEKVTQLIAAQSGVASALPSLNSEPGTVASKKSKGEALV